MHSWRIQVHVLIILVGLITGCSGSNVPDTGAQGQATSTPIPTAPAVARPTYLVQRGDVEEILEFPGRWQPRDQQPLSFEITGTVRRVNVRSGDSVTAGELLADYQITDLENQLANAHLQLQSAQTGLQSGTEGSVQTVAEAQIALANARLNLENVRAGSPWTSVASARLSVESAQNALDYAQRAYDDAVSHPEYPASTVDGAYQQLQSASIGLASAQASYDQTAQSFNNYQFQIDQAENSVIQAELNLQQAQNGGANPSAEESVRSAQLTIDQLNVSIARSSLYSPIDGVVLEVTIKPGDQVNAFVTVITVGLPEPKEALANLAIADAQKLSAGLVGICQVVNQPGTAVQCAVRRIPSSNRDADQTTRVAASLENVPDGQLITIQMPLQVRKNVVWLPPAAIRTFQNRTFVVLDTPDGPRSADIQIGLQTDDRVEIISGVNEGDVVQGP